MMHPELATLKVKIIIYGVSRFLQSDINRSSIPAKRAFFVCVLHNNRKWYTREIVFPLSEILFFSFSDIIKDTIVLWFDTRIITITTNRK